LLERSASEAAEAHKRGGVLEQSGHAPTAAGARLGRDWYTHLHLVDELVMPLQGVGREESKVHCVVLRRVLDNQCACGGVV
jgi:hypothetical protein